ncbi:hypothetical protein ACTZWT_14840 [Rhodopseudomonas sp. NSM]
MLWPQRAGSQVDIIRAIALIVLAGVLLKNALGAAILPSVRRLFDSRRG